MKNIVVIDNNVNTLTVVQLILSSEGYNVLSFTNWKEGMAEIYRTIPSLIILKVDMGNVDGRNLISQLKFDPATADIPVLLISSNNEAAQTLSEANDYITTPINFFPILQKIKNLMGIFIF